MQYLFARHGRNLEEFVNTALPTTATHSFNQTCSVTITKDESLCQKGRKELADLLAIIAEACSLLPRNLFKRPARVKFALFHATLHVHRVAFDNCEGRFRPVEIIRAREQELHQVEMLILQGVCKLVRQ